MAVCHCRAQNDLLRHDGKRENVESTSGLAHLNTRSAGPDLDIPGPGFPAASNVADDLNKHSRVSKVQLDRHPQGKDRSRVEPDNQSQRQPDHHPEHSSQHGHERSRHHSSSRHAIDSTRHRSSSRRPAQDSHDQRDVHSQPTTREARAERDHQPDSRRGGNAAGRSELRRPADRTGSSAARPDSRRYADRGDSRRPDREGRHTSRDHVRDGRDSRVARPNGRELGMSHDRPFDRHPSRGRDSHRDGHHDRGGDRDKRKREDKADKVTAAAKRR